MFHFFSKKPVGKTVTFKIQGMHCTSCSMNIDGELEDAEGVISANTSYPKSKTQITFDPQKTNTQKLKNIIESLDYTAQEVSP